MLYRNKLKKIRREKKITQKQLEKLLGKGINVCSSWESGLRNPSISDIRMIAQILQISVKEISDVEELDTSSAIDEYSANIGINLLINKLKKDPSMEKELAALITIQNRDIRLKSEVKRLANKLERYENTINNISLIVYVKDINFRYKLVNNSFMDIFGGIYTKEDIIGNKASFIFESENPDIKVIIKAEREAIQSKEKVSNIPVKIPNSNRNGLLTVVPRLDDGGNVIEITATIKDITDLHTINEKHRRLTEVVNQMDDYVWIKEITDKSIYHFVSKGVQKLSGYSYEQVFSDTDLWKSLIVEEDFKKIKGDANNYQTTGTRQHRIKDANGNIKWVESRVYKGTDINNKTIYYGINRDITDTYQMQKDREYLDKAINNSKEVILLVNQPGYKQLTFPYISNNFEGLFYFSIKEYRDNPNALIKYIHEADKKNYEHYYYSAVKEKSIDFRYIHPKNGNKIKWINVLTNKTATNEYIVFATDITKYKTSEAERKQLQIAIEEGDQLVMVANTDNNSNHALTYSYIDNRVGDYYNATKSDFQNDVECWFNSIDPEFREQVREQYKTPKFPIISYYKTINTKGESKWVYHRTIKRGNNYNSYITDITNTRESMQREEIIKRAMDKTKLSIKIKKSFGDNSYIYINKGTEEIYKIPKENFYQNPEYWRTFIPKDSNVLDLNVKYRKPREGSYQETYNIQLLDGTKKMVYEIFYKAKIFGEYYQCSIISDVTKESNEASMLLFMAKAINNVDDLVWISKPSPENKCIFMSDAVERIYGITKEKALSNPFFWIEAIVPESREEIRKKFLNGNYVDEEKIYTIIRADGSKRKLLDKKYRKSIDGETLDFGIIKDITDINCLLMKQ